MREFEDDAMSEQARLVARYPTAYERVAVVSDEGWLPAALKVLSFVLPGEARAFPVWEVAAAKAWLADGG